MKTAKLILLLALVGVVLTGCSTSEDKTATNPNDKYAMLRMPDGSIIQGVCDNFNVSYGCVRLDIDGTGYVTGLENVLIWRER